MLFLILACICLISSQHICCSNAEPHATAKEGAEHRPLASQPVIWGFHWRRLLISTDQHKAAVALHDSHDCCSGTETHATAEGAAEHHPSAAHLVPCGILGPELSYALINTIQLLFFEAAMIAVQVQTPTAQQKEALGITRLPANQSFAVFFSPGHSCALVSTKQLQSFEAGLGSMQVSKASAGVKAATDEAAAFVRSRFAQPTTTAARLQ